MILLLLWQRTLRGFIAYCFVVQSQLRLWRINEQQEDRIGQNAADMQAKEMSWVSLLILAKEMNWVSLLIATSCIAVLVKRLLDELIGDVWCTLSIYRSRAQGYSLSLNHGLKQLYSQD